MILGLSAPAIGLLGCVVSHVLLSRYRPGLRRDMAVVVAAVTGCVATALVARPALRALAVTSPPDAWATGVLWALTYWSLTYAYVFGFYNLGESARRIRLLIELRGAGKAGLTLGQLLVAYNASMILDARLQRLLASGQIVEREGRYYIGSRVMVRAAKALVFLKFVYLGVGTEFEVTTRHDQRAPVAPPGSESYRIAGDTR